MLPVFAFDIDMCACMCALRSGYGGPVTGAARDLLTALGERLTSSEAERQEEAAAYNRRL